MTSARRMAELRERRKQEGMCLTTVWLTQDEQKALDQFMSERRIESKQEAFSAVLRSGFEKEMQLAG